jgi:hypothetical protein
MTRFTDTMRPVEVRLTESLSRIENGQPVMRHGRFFANVRSDQILSLLLGLKFCGSGGLMVDSTAESEEDSLDRSARFVRRFSPLGAHFASALAGSFNVHQELIECTQGPRGIVAAIKMTFSPSSEKDREPSGSFVWLIEPAECVGNHGALWTEAINGQETASRQIPALQIGRGRRWVFQFGHNRLIGKAARRVAEVLNTGDSRDLRFADYAIEHRLSFKPNVCE